jgi:hypothetical protein
MEIETKSNFKEVRSKLARLQADVDYIKAHMKDPDIFLDAEEEKLLEESFEHEKDGSLISQEDLEKEL